MTSHEKKEIQLGQNKSDWLTSALRATLGAVPVFGAAIAELVTVSIPNQRQQRLEAFVVRLAEELSEHGKSDATQFFSNHHRIDLFEEGALQSSRALSDERLRYIAKLVAFGISKDEREQIEAKRLLKIIEGLDDDQIIVLASYSRDNLLGEQLREAHADLLQPPRVHLGSSIDEVDQETFFRLARSQLGNLGLTTSSFTKPKKGEIPEFDERTGMLKAGATRLTPLGRLLLRRIGLTTEEY
jgi:hypothetical protein